MCDGGGDGVAVIGGACGYGVCGANVCGVVDGCVGVAVVGGGESMCRVGWCG